MCKIDFEVTRSKNINDQVSDILRYNIVCWNLYLKRTYSGVFISQLNDKY